MNNITISTSTMAHTEIAALAEKRPDNVKRTMETLAKQGIITFTQIEETFKGSNGKDQKRNVYQVNQRDSYVVMAQVSPAFTGRLVDRWMQLEQATVTVAPMTPIEQMRVQLQFMEETENKLKEQQAVLDNKLDRSEFEERVSALEKQKVLYALEEGFMRLRDFHEKYGACITYNTLKIFLARTVIPVKPYCFYTREGVYVETRQVHVERSKKLIAHILTHANQVTKQRWEHPDLSGYRFKINTTKDL